MITNQAIWHRKETTNYWSNFYAQNENGAFQRSFLNEVKSGKNNIHKDRPSLSYSAD